MGFRVLADKAPVFSGFGVKLFYGLLGLGETTLRDFGFRGSESRPCSGVADLSRAL